MANKPLGELLDNRFLRQLEHLRLVPGRAATRTDMGDVASRRLGTSVEFTDFREYQPGDDFRTIDWASLARLDKLFVRLFRADENLQLELHIDASISMEFGSPTKLAYAVQLAAALGFIALHHGDVVSASVFGRQPQQRFAPARGRQAIVRLFRFLTETQNSGGTDINAALGRLAKEGVGSGIAVVISDLLDSNGYAAGLDALLRSGRQVALIHLLSPAELNPATIGDFEWIDSETKESVELAVNTETLAVYRETLTAWLTEIRSYCHRRRISYFQVDTATPVDQLVLRHLRKGGLLA
ncbi:MAG TPA: DUF58 domain-containing protein [Firmicutes bacterium]|nr:DUF58 domain-containing protein [Bacillota bacterium]